MMTNGYTEKKSSSYRNAFKFIAYKHVKCAICISYTLKRNAIGLELFFQCKAIHNFIGTPRHFSEKINTLFSNCEHIYFSINF